jgi:uncharacterized membrane protein YbaN (DUF454 family)
MQAPPLGRRSVRDRTPQILRTIAGIVLLALGVAGLVVPILPGVPLLIAAAAVLGDEHPLVRPAVGRLRRWWAKRGGQAHGPPAR